MNRNQIFKIKPLFLTYSIFKNILSKFLFIILNRVIWFGSILKTLFRDLRDKPKYKDAHYYTLY